MTHLLTLYPFVYTPEGVRPVPLEQNAAVNSALLAALYQRFGQGSGTARQELREAVVRLVQPTSTPAEIAEAAEKLHLWDVTASAWAGVLACAGQQEGRHWPERDLAAITKALAASGPDSVLLLSLEYRES